MATCANKLVIAFLELKHRMLLTGITWSGNIEDQSSISIVYRQFMALLNCMGVALHGDTPEKTVSLFEEADFIRRRPLEVYAPLLQTLEEHEPMLKSYTPWINNSFRFKCWQLEGLFKGLLLFKVRTDFRYYGPLEGMAPGIDYAHFLRSHAFSREAMQQIDHILGLLIDPTQTPADMSRLQQEFGYPADDYEKRYHEERINETF